MMWLLFFPDAQFNAGVCRAHSGIRVGFSVRFFSPVAQKSSSSPLLLMVGFFSPPRH